MEIITYDDIGPATIGRLLQRIVKVMPSGCHTITHFTSPAVIDQIEMTPGTLLIGDYIIDPNDWIEVT